MSPHPADVLIVDDEAQVCEVIRDTLAGHCLNCQSTTDSKQASELLTQGDFRVVIADVVMPDVTGPELLRLSRRHNPSTQFILISALASMEDAKQAIRDGAMDYLPKPLDLDRLCGLVDQALHDDAPPSSEDEFTAPEVLSQSHGSLDGLTGLVTPRVFHERLTEIRLSSMPTGRNCILALLNVDDFDEVNRLFGYSFGDEVLWRLATHIRARCGREPVISRTYGDEFAIVLSDRDMPAARVLVDQIREQVSRLHLDWKGHRIFVTLSAGLAEAPAGFSMTEKELLERARRALLSAKRAGGNALRTYIGQDGRSQDSSASDNGAEQGPKITRQLRLASLESVRALVSAVEAKDPYTCRHSEQVAYYAERLARHVGLPGDLIESIRIAGLAHDIGKIGIPDAVLTKPGKLSVEEFELIKQHSNTGANILEKISVLAIESHAIRHHHENWDGSGYPAGLAREEIPVCSRIIRIADSIDAMLMRRTYKSPYSVGHVLQELELGLSRDFDPVLGSAAIEWIVTQQQSLILPKESA